MTDKEFYLHKHYGIDVAKQSIPKPKETNKVYMLVHNQTKQILIKGLYSLCKWKYNQLNTFERKSYSIKQYKN